MAKFSAKKRKQLLLAAAIVVALVFALRPLLKNSSTVPESSRSGITDFFAGVGPEGSGGDPDLNRLKNRSAAPEAFEDVSIENILLIPSAIFERQGRRDRKNWSDEAREGVALQEERAVRMSGYIVRVKQSGPESANGNVDSLRDYHIWLTSSPDDDYGTGLIVEVTPRLLALHPEWRLRFLRALAKQRAHVRVTGYLLWDGEHGNEVGRSRASLWEVHPITDFEVFTNGRWQSLETSTPPTS